MMHHYWALFALPIVVACGDGKQQAAEQAAVVDRTTAVAPTDTATDLGPFDLPLMVRIPPAQATGGAVSELGWKEEEGWFGVRAGEHFALRITEEPGDVGRLKSDLDRDLVRKTTVLNETPDLLVYQSIFPDDPTLVFVHFYRVLRVGDREFVVESAPEGRFNAADVERMRNAVNVKEPA